MINLIISGIVSLFISIITTFLTIGYNAYRINKMNMPYIKTRSLKNNKVQLDNTIYYRIDPLNYKSPTLLERKEIFDNDIALIFSLRKGSEKIMTLKGINFTKLSLEKSFVNIEKSFDYSHDILDRNIVFVIEKELFPILIEVVYINKNVKYIVDKEGNYFGKFIK